MNEPPVLSDMVAYVDEGSPRATPVGERDENGVQVPIAMEATEEDFDQMLTFTKVGAELFKLNPCSGEFRVQQGGDSLNHELTREYVVQVTVRDDGTPRLDDVGTAVIIVNDVNEQCQISDEEWSHEENSVAVVGTMSVVDPDNEGQPDWKPEQQHAFSLQGDAASSFRIDAVTGEISSLALNYELQAELEFEVVAVDDGILHESTAAALQCVATVQVLLVDMNEAPVVTVSRRTVPENAVGGTLLGAPIEATDVDFGQTTLVFTLVDGATDIFAISESGQISVKSSVVVAPESDSGVGSTIDFESDSQCV